MYIFGNHYKKEVFQAFIFFLCFLLKKVSRLYYNDEDSAQTVRKLI